jgi:hypothetical protein
MWTQWGRGILGLANYLISVSTALLHGVILFRLTYSFYEFHAFHKYKCSKTSQKELRNNKR